jgi:hypothetical protein
MSLRPLAGSLALVLLSACADRALDPIEEESEQRVIIPLVTQTGLLVSEWAPIVLQDVDEGRADENITGQADFLTRFDFDGDWNAWNNWTESWVNQLPGYVYTSIVEEEKFWFITYSFFHPRDWCWGNNEPIPTQGFPDFCLDSHTMLESFHENDFEGTLFIIRKPRRDDRGTLYGIITVQHDRFNSYVNEEPFTRGKITPLFIPDGLVQFWDHNGTARPVIQIEPMGHGVFAAPDKWDVTPADHDDGNFPGGDGVIYWYRGKTGYRSPEMPAGRQDFDVAYDLLWLEGPGSLWERRYDLGVGNPFDVPATMEPSGDTYGWKFGAQYVGTGTDKAKPPWAWDVDYDEAPRGWFLEHPAGLALAYFDIPELDDWQYLYNPYTDAFDE